MADRLYRPDMIVGTQVVVGRETGCITERQTNTAKVIVAGRTFWCPASCLIRVVEDGWLSVDLSSEI